MRERTVEDELRELAEQIVAGPDDVAEFAAIHATDYKRRRAVVLGILNVDAMVAENLQPIEEQHPQLVALRVELRDRLRCLVAWGRQSGRM